MSVATIKREMPEEYAEWSRDPFRYRFPGGESLVDLNRRLSDVVLEIERVKEPVVVVSHLSTVQSLVAYFTGQNPKDTPYIAIPQHSVVKLTPSVYGGWLMDLISEEALPLLDPAEPI